MTYHDDILIARIRSLHSEIDVERQRMAVSRMNVEVVTLAVLVTALVLIGGYIF